MKQLLLKLGICGAGGLAVSIIAISAITRITGETTGVLNHVHRIFEVFGSLPGLCLLSITMVTSAVMAWKAFGWADPYADIYDAPKQIDADAEEVEKDFNHRIDTHLKMVKDNLDNGVKTGQEKIKAIKNLKKQYLKAHSRAKAQEEDVAARHRITKAGIKDAYQRWGKILPKPSENGFDAPLEKSYEIPKPELKDFNTHITALNKTLNQLKELKEDDLNEAANNAKTKISEAMKNYFLDDDDQEAT